MMTWKIQKRIEKTGPMTLRGLALNSTGQDTPTKGSF